MSVSEWLALKGRSIQALFLIWGVNVRPLPNRDVIDLSSGTITKPNTGKRWQLMSQNMMQHELSIFSTLMTKSANVATTYAEQTKNKIRFCFQNQQEKNKTTKKT